MLTLAMVVSGVPLATLGQSPAPAESTGSPAPRHLVYAFTYGTTTDLETNTGGFSDYQSDKGVPSGISDSVTGTQDQGTIVVDTLRVQPDGGLVLDVSETARGSRSAKPATCVVYADTTTVCDSSKKVNDEEVTLLRFLAPNFVDPTRLDAQRHWHAAPAGDASITADYTIERLDGTAMTIHEVRQLQGLRNRRTVIDSTIDYDFARKLPTSVHANMIERHENGSQYTTDKAEVTLALQSATASRPQAKKP